MRSIDIYTLILTEPQSQSQILRQILQNADFRIADKRYGAVLWAHNLPYELTLKLKEATYTPTGYSYTVTSCLGNPENILYEINFIKLQKYFSRLRDRIPSVPDNNFLRKETKLLLRELE